MGKAQWLTGGTGRWGPAYGCWQRWRWWTPILDPGPVSFETLGKVTEQLFGLVGVVPFPGLSQHAPDPRPSECHRSGSPVNRDPRDPTPSTPSCVPPTAP